MKGMNYSDAQRANVLILIILEYIYIRTCRRVVSLRFSVLILIILEYIYIGEDQLMSKAEISLNPYYTGIHLHKKKEILRMQEWSLNPYYTGIHLHKHFGRRLQIGQHVLILIILEYIYILMNRNQNL